VLCFRKGQGKINTGHAFSFFRFGAGDTDYFALTGRDTESQVCSQRFIFFDSEKGRMGIENIGPIPDNALLVIWVFI
jgi:hypothetical protein